MKLKQRPESGSLLFLLAAAQRGEEEALTEIITTYQARIAAYIFAITGDEASVDDLAQMTFVKMARHLAKLRSPEAFEGWLFRIARNGCMSYLRQRKVLRIFEVFSLRDHDRPSENSESNRAPAEESPLLWMKEALQRLPTSQRELLCLLEEQEFSYEELAQITGSSVAAVKSRLFRARTQLRTWRKHEQLAAGMV